MPFVLATFGTLPNGTRWPPVINHDGGQPVQAQQRLGTPLKHFHGYPRQRTPHNHVYFLGCGWNPMFTLDFPCLSAHLDDVVFFPVGEQNFTVGPPPSIDATTPWKTTRTDDVEESLLLPLCSIEVETMAFSQTAGTSLSTSSLPAGRWVKEPWPNTTVCPLLRLQNLRRIVGIAMICP